MDLSDGVKKRRISAAVGPQHAEACDRTVEDGGSIQTAVNGADGGETICVESGTYEEDISVDETVTILGLTSPHSNDPALIDGSVSLDADGSELRLITITRTADIDAPSPDAFGVRVQASNTVVADNFVYGFSGESQDWRAINGIQVFGSGAEEQDISDIAVCSNTVTGFRNETIGGVAGIKLQAGLDDVTVTRNKVSDLHSAGWTWELFSPRRQATPTYRKA